MTGKAKHNKETALMRTDMRDFALIGPKLIILCFHTMTLKVGEARGTGSPKTLPMVPQG